MLVEHAGVQPVVAPASIDEAALISSLKQAGTPPSDVVAQLARAKAETAAPAHPHDVVIGCDSMLLLGGELLGKPLTVEATITRWKHQRGRTAELLTGHAVGYRGDWVQETVATSITFGDVSDADIEAYARSGQPLQCAGAFTLEGLGSWFIDGIVGDPTSVIGLSMPLVRRALYRFGLDVSQFWG